MFSLIRYVFRGWRPVVLALGLLTISVGAILVIAAAQTTLLVADRDLTKYWRTSYDILVRPAGSRSPIEEKYGLVEANHLSGIWGGITFKQYELIKAIPGIDVVAPIAMIGYETQFLQTDKLGELSDPGIYVVEDSMKIDNGSKITEYEGRTYYYVGPEDLLDNTLRSRIISNPDPPEIYGFANLSYLLAGIEPSQEAALAGLNRSLIAGQYLKDDEPLLPQPYPFPAFPGEEPPPEILIRIPSLINVTSYVHMDLRAELGRVLLPSQGGTLQEIAARGGTDYLATLPTEVLGVTELESEQLYRRFLEEIQRGGTGAGYTLESAPSPLIYEEAVFPFDYHGLTLEIALPERKEFTFLGDTEYRFCLDPRDEETRLNAAFNISVKGVFNIDHLPKPAEINRVPLETYFPPVAILRYDEQGRPVEPRVLRPTRSTCGYIPSPPLILTTLDAARALRGEKSISAIRVRAALDECSLEETQTCALTSASQRKIEAIAIQIQQQTGLDVDIMVGSSPTRLLVHVPEIGYIEEQWIQKGVNLIYRQGIQSGNWLLLGILLVTSGLFTLDLTWSEVVARRRVIALQKALGWRSSTVFAQTVGQVVVIGVTATIAGTLIALALIRLLKWQPVLPQLLLTLPIAVIGLCIVGSLLPALAASRVAPIAEIQRGGLRYRRKTTGTTSGLWSYAWNEIKRRALRSTLTGLVSALSSGLIVLLLGATFQQRGVLGGTLLGEFLLVNIEGFHYAIVAIGFGLAALSTFNGLLNSILERRREIGILNAVGWRTSSVASLFILQGLLLGIVSGFLGSLTGTLIYLYIYQSISPNLVLIFLLGTSVPGLVGALAAIYPAYIAAQVPAAEAIRYE